MLKKQPQQMTESYNEAVGQEDEVGGDADALSTINAVGSAKP